MISVLTFQKLQLCRLQIVDFSTAGRLYYYHYASTETVENIVNVSLSVNFSKTVIYFTNAFLFQCWSYHRFNTV